MLATDRWALVNDVELAHGKSKLQATQSFVKVMLFLLAIGYTFLVIML